MTSLSLEKMKNFVFDADGVICIGAKFGVALEKEYGIPAARLKAFFADSFFDCVTGRSDLKQRLTPVLPSFGWPSTVDAFLQFWFERENVLCPDALACVQTLRQRGHRCYLGTNQEAYRVAYMRNAMGLERAFDTVFPSCEVGAAKPAPQYFEEVRRRIDCPRESLFLIDDSLRNVAAAKSCGWRALHYRGTADLTKILALTREHENRSDGRRPRLGRRPPNTL